MTYGKVSGPAYFNVSEKGASFKALPSKAYNVAYNKYTKFLRVTNGEVAAVVLYYRICSFPNSLLSVMGGGLLPDLKYATRMEFAISTRELSGTPSSSATEI